MLLSVKLRGQYLSYLHLCRAIFHDSFVDGIRLSFFNKSNTCCR
ncbi:MAG: RAxF-45 family protein [Bacillota bacterium]